MTHLSMRIDRRRLAPGAAAALAAALSLCAPPPVGAAASGSQPPGWPVPPKVSASAAVVMDAANGQVLYASHPEREEAPASLAKIMTFALALKAIRAGQVTPATKIRIGADAWHIAGNPNDSVMFLQIGTDVPVRDLLLGLMVSSGDDAAVALADGLAGTQGQFVAQMNREAAALGLVHTHFANASGLGAPGQRTTAMDIAQLSRYLIETYPNYKTYTDVKWFTWNHITQRNYNHLVGDDRSVTGLKSGHLGGPNYHLVTTAERNGMKLIVVLFGAPGIDSSATESETLLNWAYRQFHELPVPASAVPNTVPVYQGAAPRVALGTSSEVSSVTVPTDVHALRTRVTGKGYLVAPVRRGAVEGQLTVSAGGEPIAESAIVARASVARGNVFAVVLGAIGLLIHRLMSHL